MILRVLSVPLWALLGLGLALHLSIRDGIDTLAVLFYLLPLPVLLGLSLLLCIPVRGRRVAAVLSVAVMAWWGSRSFRWHKPEPATAGEIRLLFWNLDRPPAPDEPLISMIRELKPDIVACDEPGPNAAKDVTGYERALPGYDCQYMPRGILWLSRHSSRYRLRGKLDNIGAFALFDTTINETVHRVEVVDVYADPLLPRTGQLREALEHTHQDPFAIIMGDFNTPAESKHFDSYRLQGLQDALTVAGRGWRETWFYHLPLLSLDHIWLGPGWRVLEARKLWTFDSDHAAVFARVAPVQAP